MNRINTGIPGLDEMLGGGVPENNIVTVIGGFGNGKTTFALQYLCTGLKQGEQCVYISLEESESAILDTARLYGWELAPFIEQRKLALLHLNAGDVKTSVIRIESELPSQLKAFGTKRLVIDSITLFEMLFDDVSDRRNRLFDLSRIIKGTGITAMLTSEASHENPYQSRFGLVEYIADGVISLRYIRPKDMKEVTLAIEVTKMRRTRHSRAIKPYSITDKGIVVHTESEVF